MREGGREEMEMPQRVREEGSDRDKNGDEEGRKRGNEEEGREEMRDVRGYRCIYITGCGQEVT